MNGPNTYTAKDIERYHSGQMSVAEMHALEKAALDDPFLADALEGYTLTKTASTDLASLQQKLQERIEKKEEKRKVFYVSSSWIKIAALFVLFAGAGWLIYQTLSTKEEEIATTQQAPMNTPVSTPENSIDSSPVYTDAPANDALVITKKQNKQEPRKDVARQETLVSRETSNPTSPMMLQQLENDSISEQGFIASEATTRDNKPSYDSFARNTTITKRKDAFSAPLPDTIRNLDVVLKRTDVSMEEVVVLNKQLKTANARRMNVVVDTLEPAGGWTNFDNYITNNLRAPEELQSKPSRGEVELLFDVNKNGEPVNITVIKSLCTKCDEEAIRLLKEGPKWKLNKKKGKVKIKF